MIRFYYPLLALQAFCLWHAYKNRADQKWYWLIIFLPVVGCVLYLYDAFYSRRNIAALTENLKAVVNSNYKVETLEREEKFSSNNTSRTNLADAYVENGRYKEAITLYEECRQGFMSDDVPLGLKLLDVYYLDGQYDKCITMGTELSSSKTFQKSEQRIAFAWALHRSGQTERAEGEFKSMDKEFTNHQQRCAYCRFMLENGRRDEAHAKTTQLLDEFDQMQDLERHTHRRVINTVKEIRREINAKQAGV